MPLQKIHMLLFYSFFGLQFSKCFVFAPHCLKLNGNIPKTPQPPFCLVPSSRGLQLVVVTKLEKNQNNGICYLHSTKLLE